MNKDEKSAIDSLEQKLYDPKGKMENMSLHHVRDRKEKELPSSWGEDTPIIRAADEHSGLSFGAKFLLVATTLLVLVLAFTAWRVLSARNIVSEKNIDMNLDVTPYIPGGEMVPFIVTLNNRNEVSLEDATLTLMYNQGAGAQDEQEKIQVERVLGTLQSGDFKREDFEIQLYGSESETRDITVKLEYKVPGSNATFSKVATTQVVLKTPPITVAVEGPEVLSVGQMGTYLLTVKNTTSTTTLPALLVAVLPTNFTLEEAEPPSSTRGTAWEIKALSPGESTMVKITGSITGNQGETATIRALVGSVGESVGDIGVIYSSETFDVQLRSSPISLSFSTLTERGTGEGLRYGDRLTLTVHYTNQTPETLFNPSFVLKISGDAALVKDIITDQGYYDSNAGTITWNKASVPRLDSLSKDAEGTFQVIIPIVTKGSNSPKLSLSLTGTATSKEVDDVVATLSKTYVVQGSASISGQTKYRQSPFQNTGPIPPQPNVDTTYTAHLIVSAQNALQNAKVSFVLPAYVSWRNVSSDISKITYDAKTRTVTWSIGTIEAGKTVVSDIGLSVRPSQVHVNTIPSITGGIVLDADETESRAHIRTTISGLTTYIGGEEWSFNPSVVVDP